MNADEQSSLKSLVDDFLAQRRIAVAGVSRKGGTASNAIYKKLRDGGYEVFAVNPNADEVEGDACFATLADIPGGVEGVVVGTHPDVSAEVVRDCVGLGIRRIWLHRAFGQGSLSDEAVKIARKADIPIIAGACPVMYLAPVDVGHKCIRWFLGVTGKLPRP